MKIRRQDLNFNIEHFDWNMSHSAVTEKLDKHYYYYFNGNAETFDYQQILSSQENIIDCDL